MSSRLHEPSIDAGERRPRSHDRRRRSVLAALYAGLATTMVATAAPFVDQATSHTLEDHIRSGYPDFTQARVATAVTTYEVILTVIGVLGLAGWVFIIRAVSIGRKWTVPLATALFGLGLAIALTGLLVKDTSGESGLSPLLGWVGLLPCVPGLIVVALLWRRP